MERAARIQRYFATFVAVASTTVSLSLRKSIPLAGIWVTIGLLVASVVLAMVLPPIAMRALGQSRLGRKLLLGRAWVEGHWVLVVTDLEANWITSGLSESKYDPSTLKCTITGYFPEGIRARILATATSDFVHLRESDLREITTFTTGMKGTILYGVSMGRYFQVNSRMANEYDGCTYLLDGGPVVREIGAKLSRSEVRRLQKMHPDTWREEAVRLAEPRIRNRIGQRAPDVLQV